MSEEFVEPKKNLLVSFGFGVISFIVGLSAFFIIKVIFMIPINIMTTAENIDTMKSVGSLSLLFCVYLSVKYTKTLNVVGTRKIRNIVRIFTFLIGILCLFGTVGFLSMHQ